MKHMVIKGAFGALLAGLAAFPAAAAENPMDHMGIQHNMYLACLNDIDADMSEALALVVDKCGFKPETSREEFIKLHQPLVDMDPMQPLAEKMAPFRGNYSAYEFSFFERIDGVVRTAKDLSQAAAMFAELEAEAIDHLDPKTRSGANVLTTLSVARHSLRYWEQYAAKTDPKSRRKWWHWLVIGIADAAGAVLAAETGPIGAAAAGATVSVGANQVLEWVDP